MRIPSSLRTAFAGVAAAIGVFVAGCGSSSSSPRPVPRVSRAPGPPTARAASFAFSNTCFPSSASADSGVDLDGAAVDGAPSGPARPEELGQPCATTANCGAGLTCVPFSSAIGGLCDYTNFGVNPDAGSTGKTCTGECSTAADCCELPPPTFTGSGTFYDYSDSGVYLGSTNVYADQCSAVLQALGGSVAVCASPDANSPNDTAILHMCFYYQTYCGSGCAANWSCTNNACVYSGSCTLNAGSANPGSCPTYTRTGRVTGQNCIAANDAGGGAPGTPGSCSAAPTTCATNAECNGQTIADPSTLSFTGSTTCEGGDCACYQNKCYFGCTQDINCAGGYACDTATGLCKRASPPGCQSNSDCATMSVMGMSRNAKAICQSSTRTCAVPCSTDHDCSISSGAVPSLGPFSGYVCSAGFCTAVATSAGSCTTNADCRGLGGGSGNVNLFCVTPTTVTAVESAISGN